MGIALVLPVAVGAGVTAVAVYRLRRALFLMKNIQAPRRAPACAVRVAARRGVPVEIVLADAERAISINTNKYNVALIGPPGVGKSRLIKAITGLEDIVVGCAGETTLAAASYTVPGAENLLLWDMPGAGTARNPSETYYADKRLEVFDVVIIAYSQTITEEVALLAEQAHANEQPFFLIRTKADEALVNMKRDRPEVTFSNRKPVLKGDVEHEVRRQWDLWRARGFTDAPTPDVLLWSSKDFETFCAPDPRGLLPREPPLPGSGDAAALEAILARAEAAAEQHAEWHALHDPPRALAYDAAPRDPPACQDADGPTLAAFEWSMLHPTSFGEAAVIERIHAAACTRFESPKEKGENEGAPAEGAALLPALGGDVAGPATASASSGVATGAPPTPSRNREMARVKKGGCAVM